MPGGNGKSNGSSPEILRMSLKLKNRDSIFRSSTAGILEISKADNGEAEARRPGVRARTEMERDVRRNRLRRQWI
eukprot:1393548-Amorphochlora_amoeboformis.AAC.2